MEAYINPPQSDYMDFYDVVIMGGALRGSNGNAAIAAKPGNSDIDSGEIDKTLAARRRSNGRGQRLFHGPSARVDAISQRIASREARIAVLVYKRRSKDAGGSERARAALSGTGAIVSAGSCRV